MKIASVQNTLYAKMEKIQNLEKQNAAAFFADEADTEDLSDKNKDRAIFSTAALSDTFENIHRTEQNSPEGSAPIRSSIAQLTQRLVSATGQFAVRQIIAEANGELLDLRLALAFAQDASERDAILAVIRRFDRLMARSFRKIRDLDQEDMLRLEKTRAKREDKDDLAHDLSKELHRRVRERMAREERYLRDRDCDERKTVFDAPSLPFASDLIGFDSFAVGEVPAIGIDISIL